MDCCNLSCSKQGKENTVCRKCYMRIYCSDVCKESDWNALHKSQCKSQLFTTSDFNPIKLQKLLGRGTYGDVQLVKHKSTGQLYALKEIRKHTKDRRVPIKMLFREISVQRNLIHANMIRLYGHIETLDRVILVLEYADGGDLYAHLKKKLRLPEREACRIFSEICEGVKYLHGGNIIHRDIKPENILMTKTGGIKICDFGWCAVGDTERSTYCGTLDYMAPEILAAGTYSNKVDIWSLGILLYEILHGATPFKGKNQIERLNNINKGKLEFGFSISRAAKNIITSMLAKNPSERPNVTEVLECDWVSRYSDPNGVKSPLGSPVSMETFSFEERPQDKDAFDIKLSKNYPASYKRISGYSSNLNSLKAKIVISVAENATDEFSNSNKSSFVEESKENRRERSTANIDILSRQIELEKLQEKLEGRKTQVEKSKGFLSRFMSAIGIS